MKQLDFRYGHLMVTTESGTTYLDDGSPVDRTNYRPCKACGCKCEPGNAETDQGDDPCITGLPQVWSACCGHGLDKVPGTDYLPGWVCLTDGRKIVFSGTLGGARIREAVECTLKNQPLPEGFTYDGA